MTPHQQKQILIGLLADTGFGDQVESQAINLDDLTVLCGMLFPDIDSLPWRLMEFSLIEASSSVTAERGGLALFYQLTPHANTLLRTATTSLDRRPKWV